MSISSSKKGQKSISADQFVDPSQGSYSLVWMFALQVQGVLEETGVAWVKITIDRYSEREKYRYDKKLWTKRKIKKDGMSLKDK